MAPIIDTTTGYQSPKNNKMYTTYFPKFIIALIILYAICFLIRLMIRKYRRMRDRQQQQEIRRLKQLWIYNMKKYQFKEDSLLFTKEKMIDFPPSTYNESFHSNCSSPTLNNSPTSHYKFFQQSVSSSSSSAASTSSSRTIGNNKKDPTPSTKSTSSNWKIKNTKRLNILWQWSVSMGYIEYQHAKDLNSLIDELSTKQHQVTTTTTTTTAVDYLQLPPEQQQQ